MLFCPNCGQRQRPRVFLNELMAVVLVASTFLGVLVHSSKKPLTDFLRDLFLCECVCLGLICGYVAYIKWRERRRMGTAQVAPAKPNSSRPWQIRFSTAAVLLLAMALLLYLWYVPGFWTLDIDDTNIEPSAMGWPFVFRQHGTVSIPWLCFDLMICGSILFTAARMWNQFISEKCE